MDSNTSTSTTHGAVKGQSKSDGAKSSRGAGWWIVVFLAACLLFCGSVTVKMGIKRFGNTGNRSQIGRLPGEVRAMLATPVSEADPNEVRHRVDSLMVLLDSPVLAKDSTISGVIDQEPAAAMFRASSPLVRSELLSRAHYWHYLRMQSFELWLFLTILVASALLICFYRKPRLAYSPRIPGTQARGQRQIPQLIHQDFDPVAYDVHFGHFEDSNYRGAIHWLRDITEKLLSVVLILAFDFYVAKAVGYFVAYASGEGWQLVFIPLDINMALAMSGWFLIIDGLIQVSAMFDAPGVSRTVDSLIVIVAGFIVMLVEAAPGMKGLVTFNIAQPWLAVSLSGIIALLFIVRVAVGHWRFKAEAQNITAEMMRIELEENLEEFSKKRLNVKPN